MKGPQRGATSYSPSTKKYGGLVRKILKDLRKWEAKSGSSVAVGGLDGLTILIQGDHTPHVLAQMGMFGSGILTT